METREKAAFLCYLIVIISGVTTGLIYISSKEIMPYHQQVIGMGWNQLEPQVQALFLAFMRGIGFGIFATSLSMMIMLFIPFRRGEYWPRWSIPFLGLVLLLPGLYLALNLYITTGAPTPWPFLLILLLLLILGYILSNNPFRFRAR